jgi:predicted Zn-ribbon and HTH transcriptional regulator
LKEEKGMAYEPSDREDEYFMKLDKERIGKMRSGLDTKREEEFKLHRRDTHWMKCPKCGHDLEEINYQDVMIDRCPDCKGMWLDHDEIELLGKGEAKMTKGFLRKVFG